MEQLTRLKARISNLNELRDLFRALRAMAASHVQEAHEALEGIREYVRAVEAAIAESAALLPNPSRKALPMTGEPVGARVVVCSEHGFIGDFNERVFELAQQDPLPSQQLIVIGRRGALVAEEMGIEIERTYPMAIHMGGVLRITRYIAERVAGADYVDAVFATYKRGDQYEIARKNILPLDQRLLGAPLRRNLPLAQLPPEILLRNIANEYLFAELTRAVIESFASENGARLQRMENADHNIDGKLEVLLRAERELSHETITSELLDVVIGAEAITETNEN